MLLSSAFYPPHPFFFLALFLSALILLVLNFTCLSFMMTETFFFTTDVSFSLGSFCRIESPLPPLNNPNQQRLMPEVELKKKSV